MTVNVNELREKFEELYGKDGDCKAYFAPGRVNLIGEHTDYNGGHVFLLYLFPDDMRDLSNGGMKAETFVKVWEMRHLLEASDLLILMKNMELSQWLD